MVGGDGKGTRNKKPSHHPSLPPRAGGPGSRVFLCTCGWRGGEFRAEGAEWGHLASPWGGSGAGPGDAGIQRGLLTLPELPLLSNGGPPWGLVQSTKPCVGGVDCRFPDGESKDGPVMV